MQTGHFDSLQDKIKAWKSLTPDQKVQWRQEHPISPLPRVAEQPKHEVCPTCSGQQWVTHDVPVDHADFGKAFPCPDCKEPQLKARAEKQAQERLNSTIRSAGLSVRHMFTFDDFLGLDEHYREGKMQAAELCIELTQTGQICVGGVVKVGLLMWGTYGVGKTTLGTSALIDRAKMGDVILRVKFADFLDDVRDAYGRPDMHPEDIIRVAQEANFALLDDMGDPKSDKELSADQRRIAHKLLEYRNEFVLPTIITTNCSLKQLETQLTTRTFERVRELCLFEEVSGVNLRQ